MGGVSSEHEISLSSGRNVLAYLDKNKYIAKLVIISKKGDWIMGGRKTAANKAVKGVDVVFNALHGEYGEDGCIQGLLDSFGKKYTGSGVLASALGMDKIKSKELFQYYGLNVPNYIVLDKKSDSAKINFKKLGNIWVIKPAYLGSSVGVSIVKNKKDLKKAINRAFEKCAKVIVEKYIDGQEMTCGVLDNFNGQEYFALPITEIIPPPGRFFDYQVKYNGSTQEITPARINKSLAKKIQEIAIQAHEILGCKGYSRTDFIVKANRIYILEVNTLPGLTKESLFPKAAWVAGIEFLELLDIIINNALH